ncbi:heat shock protein [Klebsormidium nitens]|uniref:Heat shock protein n=1 Tax=Klebsormidium nitens TaxID=105231 RepID=A0A1Y1I4J6_KLENI|nr:heat shock protein [Klebsormidium nitens]|eukprot:GAQ84882.1 heat shock protein [Klebsormidium nitens]
MAQRRLGSQVEEPDLDLYGILNVPKDASDDELLKAYRGLAMLCHPDKVPGGSTALKAVATEQFNRIRDAYETLSDPQRREIYDIYGKKGLASGMDLGEHLGMKDEMRKAYELYQMRQSENKLQSRLNQTSTLLTSIAINDWRRRGVQQLTSSINSTVTAPISPKDTLIMGGSVGVKRGHGVANQFLVWKHQADSRFSYEAGAVLGIRQILTGTTTMQLSKHMTASLSANYNIKDGSLSQTCAWSRQLTPNVRGDIALTLGPDMGVAVGWSRDGTKNSLRGDLRMGTAFGVAGNWVHHFSDKSFGKVSAKIGITAIEVEIGAHRILSERSSGGFSCTVGVQGVLWKIRYTRGGQKFIIPILLSDKLEPFTILAALCLPPALYALVRHYYLKPAAIKRRKRKTLAARRANAQQVRESIEAARGVQDLMSGSASRKKANEENRANPGLVIVEAVYGCIKPRKKRQNGESDRGKEVEEEGHDGQDEGLPPPFLDVTTPVQFLVDDSAIKLHPGIRKAGLMGFCDPCPGEEKELRVKYKWRGNVHETTVGDKEALFIPDRRHKVTDSES